MTAADENVTPAQRMERADRETGLANPKARAWDLIGAAYWNRGYDGGPSTAGCDLYLDGLAAGDRVLLVGASTVRLATSALARGLHLTVADFSPVMLAELENVLGGRAQYVLADVTGATAQLSGSFRAVLADRLINRFTLDEMRTALTALCAVLQLSGQLRLSYRLGLYERDRPVLAEARRRGALSQVFDEASYDIDYSPTRSWLPAVLPAHGEIDPGTLADFYAERGREHRLRRGELDALVESIAAEKGLLLDIAHIPLEQMPNDYLLQVTRTR